ncbi:Long chain fatty acid CoA ligase [Spironucleus salmonicida]|uniref:Long chain fatty acid CoA ligase n=1 Tax=Spironucleus salmonicida TaxID=348837 RepID=V6LIK7_9EUKA|nr:Long chain fatty acid CoA ligase [Spironucleus salmonicida]|eukprot:EST44425.1 Long chain fatty acid CoA ligase [Spironucleus salmonicida]
MFPIPFTPPKEQYQQDIRFPTLPHLFQSIANENPDLKCLGTRTYHVDARGSYRWFSYSEILQLASNLQQSLKVISEGEKYIGIISQNRTEWTVLDLAAAGLGLITVPLYDTQSNQDCEHILSNTNVKIIFCEVDKAAKFEEIFNKFNIQIYVFDDGYREREWMSGQSWDFTLPEELKINLKMDSEFTNPIYKSEKKPTYTAPTSLEIFTTSYKVMLPDIYPKINVPESFKTLIKGSYHSLLNYNPENIYINNVTENSMYTLVFTSGTTSLPKSVSLTFKNFMAVALSMQQQCLLEGGEQQDYMISYMPLAHIYMRVLQTVAFAQIGAQGYISATAKTLLDDIQSCAPTALFLVPRVVQKIYDGILQKIKNSYFPIRMLFKLCLNLRVQAYNEQAIKLQILNDHRRPCRSTLDAQFKAHYGVDFGIENVLNALQIHPKQREFLANFYAVHSEFDGAKTPKPSDLTSKMTTFAFNPLTNFFFSKITSLTGGRLRGAVSGSAAIQQNQGQFFRICFNCKLFQGYGLSETSAGGTVQSYLASNYKGVGWPVSSDVKISLKSTSDYLVSDFPFPRGEIVISGNCVQNGEQFATADIGQFNFITGELEIVDRIKNIIKLSQGEFVQLGEIELCIQKHNSCENCFIWAQTWMKWLICIISLNKVYLKYSFPQFYGKKLSVSDYNTLNTQMQIKLTEFCKKKGLKGFQIPKYFLIDFTEFNVENDLLTSAFKVKRGSCSLKYGCICEEIYHLVEDNKEVKIAELMSQFGVDLLGE